MRKQLSVRVRRGGRPGCAGRVSAAGAAAVALGFGAVAAGAATPPVAVSEAPGRRALDVTIYNNDLALVREVRAVELPAGACSLEFREVPAQIVPQSLLVDFGAKSPVRLLEQDYEFDLLSRDKILEKYIGQEIAWIQEDGKRISGRLLGMTAGPVFEVGGEVVFEVPGRIALPALPASLRARPTLVWRLDAGRGGATEVEASYLTHGVSWSTDYVLQLDPKGERAGLQAWVSIDNRSGGAFADARLLLVAGEINQVRPQPAPRLAMMKVEGAADYAAGVQEEALYDYHLYTLPGTTTLKDAQLKQVSLFEADGIGVKRHYRLGGQGYWFQSPRPKQKSEEKVAVSLTFENRQANGLGLPLPAGTVRVYGQAASGGRQLLGEDRIDHTPQDEEVELQIGVAFDLVAERTQTDYKRIADNVHQSAYRIVLRNHKTEAVTVEVVEPTGGDWQVLESSLPARRKSVSALEFDVPVPAGGETVLTYRLQVSY
ncbi:MAG: DUF4139 domain-containing protein [Candidatus Krumholzibacteriia bacterium]